VYSEYSSNGTSGDLILLPVGIDSGDVTFYRANFDSLFITVGDLGSIEIDNFYYSAYDKIETLEFNDTSTIDLTALAALDFYGTQESEYLIGTDDIAETMYGYGGDDTLWAYDGNNILDGGAGNDTLIGGNDDDTIIFSPGFDSLYDYDGEDTLVVPEGYTMDDVYFFNDVTYSGSVDVFIDGLGQLILGGQLYNDTHTPLNTFTSLKTIQRLIL
jgi:Ca2+-binding RTX toxin-like protein